MRGVDVGFHCYWDFLREVIGTSLERGRVCECLSGGVCVWGN